MQPQPPPGYYYAPAPPPKSNTLWIALGIVGAIVLIVYVRAVLMPSTTDRMKKTRRGEAEVQLERIKRAAKAHYAETAAFPTTAAARIPDVACCDSGSKDRKCAPDASQWYGTAWDELGFSMDEPHYYQYQYVPAADGQSFTAYAIGDLDCDDHEATYELVGTVEAGNPTFELIKPARVD